MDKNLNSVQKENLIKLVIDLTKEVEQLKREVLKITKRVQVLEP